MDLLLLLAFVAIIVNLSIFSYILAMVLVHVVIGMLGGILIISLTPYFYM